MIKHDILKSHCQKVIGCPVNKDNTPNAPPALFNIDTPNSNSTPIYNGMIPKNFCGNTNANIDWKFIEL